ncbi:MAG: DUF721 domain-containing protein [Planctomycetes bacterium]|nr:DUF721 domain-containing protein [Planctomycetota bacterium]
MASERKKPAPAQGLGDILKGVVRKEGLGKRQLQGRRLARKVLAEILGEKLAPHADVLSVKTGVVTVEADSAALFQELEGYRRQELLDAFRAAGLAVREVRVKLASGDA